MTTPNIIKRKKMSEETKRKISESKKGKTSWNKGLPAPWAKKRMLENNPMKQEHNRQRMRKHNPMSHDGEVAYKRADYKMIHAWITRALGKPKKCEHCGIIVSNSRKIHWANISREYKKDTKDWIRLCTKCHREYDKKQTNHSPTDKNREKE